MIVHRLQKLNTLLILVNKERILRKVYITMEETVVNQVKIYQFKARDSELNAYYVWEIFQTILQLIM